MKKTINSVDRVVVCSRSFSRNKYLRAKLCERYSCVKFNDDGMSLKDDSLVAFLQGHEKAIIGLEVIDESVLRKVPELRVVGKYGVGLDGIDLQAMHKYGVQLGWTPGVNRRSVSELVVGLAILLLRNIPIANREVQKGLWKQHTGSLLSNRKVGIIGCGAIGQDLVSLLKPYQCEIIVHDIRTYEAFFAKNEIQKTSLIELLRQSDIVTIHLPLDKSTKNLLSGEVLREIKKGAILINTARGGIVDEEVLKELLVKRHIAAAGFDVFQVEPPNDPELLSLPNLFITPHIGGSSDEAIMAMGDSAIDGLDNAVNALSN